MSRPFTVLGIDAGKKGAIAAYRPATGWLEVYDVPTYTTLNSKGRRFTKVDLDALTAIKAQIGPFDVAVHEKVAARTGEAPSYAFEFGYTSGLLMGVFLPAPHVIRVTPQIWKAELNVSAVKNEARERASELLPHYAYLWARKKDDGRAEAAMIALWGANRAKALGLGGENGPQ